MGFSRQEQWSGWPFPSPGDLPDPGIKPRYPKLQADSLSSELPGKPLGFFSLFLLFNFHCSWSLIGLIFHSFKGIRRLIPSLFKQDQGHPSFMCWKWVQGPSRLCVCLSHWKKMPEYLQSRKRRHFLHWCWFLESLLEPQDWRSIGHRRYYCIRSGSCGGLFNLLPF